MDPKNYWEEDDHQGPDFDRPPEWDPIDGDTGGTDYQPGSPSRSIKERYDDTKRNIDDIKDLAERAKARSNAAKGAGGAKDAGTAAKGAEAGKAAGAAKGANAAKGAGAAAKAGSVAKGAAGGAPGIALSVATTVLSDKKARAKLGKTISAPILLILGLIFIIVLIFSDAAQKQDYETKERATEAVNRTEYFAIQYRRSYLRNLAYFYDPNSCGEPIMCTIYPGVTQREINKMRNLQKKELLIEDSDIIKSGDKMYLSQIRYKDLDGTTIYTVNSSTFPDAFQNDSKLYSPIEKITSNESIFWRSPRSIDRLNLYSINRNNPYSDEIRDTEKLVRPFREVVFGVSANNIKCLEYGLCGPISGRASSIQATMMDQGIPETIISNTTAMDTPDNDAVIEEQIGEDNTKQAVLQAFDNLETKEKVCSFVFGFDAMNFNIKMAKARSLAKYAAHWTTMADAHKSDAVTDFHLSLLNGIKNAPSIDTDTWGLAFPMSEGYQLTTSGQIKRSETANGGRGEIGGLSRAETGGNPSLLYINQLVGNLNSATPVDDATSSPFWTSEYLIKAYDKGYGEEACDKLYELTGNPSARQLQLMRMILGQYMTPQFVLNLAGGISPDPRTDREKGYGAGNSHAAGLGALSSSLARTQGMEAQSYSIFPQLVKDANDTSFSNGFIGDTTKKEPDNYRNKLCNDRTISAYGLATDMFCNIQWSFDKGTLLSERYRPEKVIEFMRTDTDWPIGTCYVDGEMNARPRVRGPDGNNDNGDVTDCGDVEKVPHIDANGNIQTQRFRDFMTHCIESDKPIIDEAVMGERQWHGESAAYCATHGDEVFRYFRLFVLDQNIVESEKLSIEDRLGTQAGSPAAAAALANTGGGGGGAGGGGTASGNSQELAQQILDCSNVTVATGAWKSSGVSSKQQLENLAAGKSSIPGYQYSIHPLLLQVVATNCQKYSFSLGSQVRTEQTSGGTSVHPLGLAIDIGRIGSNELNVLDSTYRNFLLDTQAIFQQEGQACRFGVWPSLVSEVKKFISYCTVFADAGTGPHLHIALPRSAITQGGITE